MPMLSGDARGRRAAAAPHNAAICQETAARYERLAESAADPRAARSLRELARLWLTMAVPARSFDRSVERVSGQGGDWAARERIFALIDEVAAERRKVA